MRCDVIKLVLWGRWVGVLVGFMELAGGFFWDMLHVGLYWVSDVIYALHMLGVKMAHGCHSGCLIVQVTGIVYCTFKRADAVPLRNFVLLGERLAFCLNAHDVVGASTRLLCRRRRGTRC